MSCSSSARALASRKPVASRVSSVAADAAAAGSPLDASTSFARPARSAAGRASVASQFLACTARSSRTGCDTPRLGSVSSARRATRYAASATSRWPPSADRPASAASPAKRNVVGSTAYGGFGTSDNVLRGAGRRKRCLPAMRSRPPFGALYFPPWRNR